MSVRIELNIENLRVDIEKELSELGQLQNEPIFQTIMNKGIGKKIKQWEILLKNRLDTPFNLVVVGDFKRGKSTLINAILGQYIVPTNALPETITINKLIYSEQEYAKIVLKNGKKANINIGELSKPKLKEIIKELSPEEVDYIEIALPHPLLKEINIIDTPGINDIFKKFDSIVSRYLENADAILYVFSARAALSQTEKEFLHLAEIPKNFSRVFLLLNMIDTFDTIEDIDKIYKNTEKSYKNILSNANIFPMSALDEYCRLTNKKRPNNELEQHLENYFEFFRIALDTDIVIQKDIIRATRIAKTNDCMLNDIQEAVSSLIMALSDNLEELTLIQNEYLHHGSALNSKIEEEKNTLYKSIDKMQAETLDWLEEFLIKLKAEIESLKDANLESLQKFFQFYLIEKIREAILACIEIHKQEIIQQLNTVTQTLSLVNQFKHRGSDSIIAENIVDISWTNIDSAVFVTELLLNNIKLNLGPLMLIGMAVTGFLREKKIESKQTEFLDPILKNFDAISREVYNGVSSIYSNFKINVENEVRNFYDEQVENSIQILNQAKYILNEEEIKTEEATEYLFSLNKKIDKFKEISSAYLK